MENEQDKTSRTLKTTKRILSVSLAAASLLASATAALGSALPTPVGTAKPVTQISSTTTRTVPPQLVLKHADQNQQLVAQHGSHSSHSSHGSHGSHGSHASHASGL
jgi:hypothetical protein